MNVNSTTDVLVIGSGLAGLHCALETSLFAKVTVITKDSLQECNTNYAQGGIAAVLDKLDDPAKHFLDTMKAGAFYNKEDAVELVVKTGPDLVRKLAGWGVKFDMKDNEFLLAREGGHSCRRIAYSGDRTGAAIEETLIKKASADRHITIIENAFVYNLIKKNGRVTGCRAINKNNLQNLTINCKAVVMASGGAGQIYCPNTSNPKVATGDGLALGLKAGCQLKDMEFMQFHPTVLNKEGCEAFLITESLRGEGAYLVNEKGERFMEKYDERKELATRDIISRAIVKEMKFSPVFLDARHLDPALFDNHFYTIDATLKKHGINPRLSWIPIAPAAHYTIGGIATDLKGYTGVSGLYACGEVACSGLHGANRLASNSLLEALVFSHLVAEALKKELPDVIIQPEKNKPPTVLENWNEPLLQILRQEICDTMWNDCGIIRNEENMEKGLKHLNSLKEELEALTCHHYGFYEIQNMHTVAMQIMQAALNRKESLGVHFRED